MDYALRDLEGVHGILDDRRINFLRTVVYGEDSALESEAANDENARWVFAVVRLRIYYDGNIHNQASECFHSEPNTQTGTDCKNQTA